MVALVFVIGILNLVVGFALAVALEGRIVLYLPTWRRESVASAPDALVCEPQRPHDPARELVLRQVPDQWAAMLENANAEFRSFVEASLHVLKLEVGAYREDLLDLEDLVRSAVAENNAGATRDAVQALVALNDEWVTRQTDAIGVMAEKRDALGAYIALADQLEQRVISQAPAIKEHCRIIASCDLKTDADAGAKIVQELGQLIRLAHELRDAIQESMTAIVVHEDRLDTVAPKQLVDPMTGLRNRVGVERQFRKWWREDDRRERLLSVALIDIDRFGKTNEFASTRVADRIVQAVAGLLKQLVSRDSGFESVFRLDGHQFLLFFGDASCDAAVGNLQRVRQAIDATRFECKEKQYLLKVRVGVTAVRPEEGTEEVLHRLQELVAAAKSAGGNRTYTDNGQQPDMVQPHALGLQLRTITVE